jgi:RNA polymerase sigma-70 factor (sigma-E family)
VVEDAAMDVGPQWRPTSDGPLTPPSRSRPQTLAEFYKDSYVPMVRLAILLTGSTEVAQDLVQDSFVKLHRRWTAIDDPQAYLRRVVVNTCRSHHRRRARDVNARDRLVADLTPVVLAADELGDALARLPYRQHAALVLRFYEDLSEADIARALGCRPGTVGSLVSRGLAELRKVVEQ